MSYMSQAEYARHRKVTDAAVKKMIETGRIPPAAVKVEKGRKKIDAAAADLALGDGIEQLVAQEAAAEREADDEVDDRPVPFAASNGHPALTKARTATEIFRSRLAQLEYDQRVGKLLSVDDVQRSMEIAAEAMVRDLDQLPARADDLAAAFSNGGVEAVRKLLRQVSREVRASLAAHMRILPAEQADVAAADEAVKN